MTSGHSQLMAVNAGIYVSALSMLTGSPMSMDEKENFYITLLPKIRFFLNELPVFLPASFQDFSEQKGWEVPILDFMQERKLNVYFAFGIALWGAQIRPEVAKAQVIESGNKIGIMSDILESLIHRFSISSIDKRGELTDEFVMDQFGGSEDKTQDTSTITIIFLAADASDATRLRIGEEFREIQERLKLAKMRDYFKLELPQLSLRPADISQALLDTKPQIVHFSGHGMSTGALCFENQVGQIQLVQPEALAALFEQFANQVNCVLLNACFSDIQARAIAKHIKYVIGMKQSVSDKAAIAFTIGFYQALGAGRTIEEAYNLGCVQIILQNIPEYLTPVLIKKMQAQS